MIGKYVPAAARRARRWDAEHGVVAPAAVLTSQSREAVVIHVHALRVPAPPAHRLRAHLLAPHLRVLRQLGRVEPEPRAFTPHRRQVRGRPRTFVFLFVRLVVTRELRIRGGYEIGGEHGHALAHHASALAHHAWGGRKLRAVTRAHGLARARAPQPRVLRKRTLRRRPLGARGAQHAHLAHRAAHAAGGVERKHGALLQA